MATIKQIKLPNGTVYDISVPISQVEVNSTLTMNGNNISGAGTITAAAFQASSDARLKTNITPYENKKSILDLPVYKFDFIDGPKEQIGCLAQELQEICPELVQEKEDGYLSINENKLVYLLLEEVKRLNKKLEEV